MEVFSPILNTREIPETYTTLEQELPSIFTSRCFNENNFPFDEEVNQTEIGHLFEHIILEYLCLLKIEKGAGEAVFSGETNWNWEREKRGIFHIQIHIGQKDNELIVAAIQKSIVLLEFIMQPQLFSTPNSLTTFSNHQFEFNSISVI